MFKGFTEFASLLKDAHKIPEVMNQARERLERETIIAEAGGGAVTITLNGLGDIRDVRIVPAVIASGDPTPVERFVHEAMEDAKRKLLSRMADVFQRVANDSNLNFPGLKNILQQLGSASPASGGSL